MKTDIKAGSAYVELLLKNQAFTRGLEASSAKLKAFAFASAKMAALGIFAGGAALAVTTTKWAAALEVARAQFEALTGSAAKASAIIAGLEKFGPTALIPMDELQRTTQLLLGYGIAAENVVPTVKALAEISRGNADRFNLLALAFGQVAAKQRLYAAEVRQFVESGFNPLQQIAQQTGETMAEVSARLEAGGISAREVASALEAAVGPGGRFHGLLAKMGDTAYGAFNKLKTGVMLALRPIGEALLPSLTQLLNAANGIMPVFADVVLQSLAHVKIAFAGVADTVGATMSFIGNAISTGWSYATSIVTGALKAIVFAIDNWENIMAVAVVRVELAVVRLANQMVHVFTETIPAYLTWFANNWRDVFTDIATITATITSNIGNNLKAFWEAIKSWMAGDGFNFKWTKLTDGFESVIKELPKVAERQMGPLEASLQKELDGLVANADFDRAWRDSSNAVDQGLEDLKRQRDELVAAMKATGGAEGESIIPAMGGLDGEKMKKDVFVAFSAAAAARQTGDKPEDKIVKGIQDATKEQTRHLERVLRDGGVFA